MRRVIPLLVFGGLALFLVLMGEQERYERRERRKRFTPTLERFRESGAA